jgi:hypothetical protein
MVNVMTAGRPPYVQFEERSREDRTGAIENGRAKHVSEDWVIIRQVGSKDTVEKLATDWLGSLRHNTNIDPQWAREFHNQYKLWKEGHEVTPDGSHIREWALISKSQAETIIAAGVRTVEDLANANEPTLMSIGIGGRDLKMKAIAWLETASKTGRSSQEVAALRANLEAKDDAIAQLRAQLASMNDKINKMGRVSAGETTDDFLEVA